MELCRQSDAILFGAVGGLPPGSQKRPESALLQLRKDLELYANLRPVKPVQQLLDASTIKREVLEGTDLLVVRELTGGLYFGKPSEIRETEHGAEAVKMILAEGTQAAMNRFNRRVSPDEKNNEQDES